MTGVRMNLRLRPHQDGHDAAIADALAQVSEAERNNPVAQGRSKSQGRSWSKDQYQA